MAPSRSWLIRRLVPYLAAALILTALSVVLNRFVAHPTGLVRSYYPITGFAGRPFSQETTTDVSLAFLDDQPGLPRRFFSVRWSGFWFFPREQTVSVYTGGDDRVILRIDGQVVLRRRAGVGMGIATRTLTLDAGAHEIAIDFEQERGSFSIDVRWAPVGGPPRPLSPHRLFPEPVTPREYWLTTSLSWLHRISMALWLAPVAALFLALSVRVLLASTRAAHRLGRRWRERWAPRTAREFWRRMSPVFAPALLGPVVFFLTGPLTTYEANRAEFSVPFAEILPWLLAIVCGSWALFLLAGSVAALLSERLVRMYVALVVCIGALAWAQGNLWVGDYGVLDGRDVNWDLLAWRAPYELTAWVVVPALTLVYWRSISRVAPFGALVFLGLQAAAVVFAVFGQTGVAREAQWEEPPPRLFQFSSRQNVIHIVLDEFQSDLFAEILENDRAGFDRTFDGFVYFADHLGAFPTTSLAMPAMLTGREYRNEQPVPDFVSTAFRESSLFERLNRRGFEIDGASILPGSWFDAWFGPDGTPLREDATRFTIPKPFVSRRDYQRFAGRQLIELSVLRHVPHNARVALGEHPAWFDRAFQLAWVDSEAAVRRHEASNSKAFFEEFIKNMTVDAGRPRYKLLHLGLPHRPVVLDEHCRFIGLTSFSRQAYVNQSRCAITLVVSFLDRLRSSGIYESSLIIVSSDHGTDLEPRGFVGKSASLPLGRNASTPRLSAIIGSAKALMLIKPPNRRGSLVVSEAPTAHVDLQATVLDLLGLQPAGEDASMFRRNPGNPRQRAYGMYDVGQRFPTGYLSRLDLLSIDRQLVDASGWHHARTILPPDVRLDAQAIDFGSVEAIAYLGPGWSTGERELAGKPGEVSFVRSLAAQAVVLVSLPREPSELIARLAVLPSGGVAAIVVELDGRVLQRWVPAGGDGFHDYTVSIPPDPARSTVSALTFRLTSEATTASTVKLDRMALLTN